MKKETREILERGRLEELKVGGSCIHKFPQFETTNYLEMYDKLVQVEPMDDLIADSMARLWKDYFELGSEAYKEKHKVKPKESKRLEKPVITKVSFN